MLWKFSPGTVRRSRVRRQAAATVDGWSPPRIVPKLSVGEPRIGCRRASSRGLSSFSTSARNIPAAETALIPFSGVPPCAERPWRVDLEPLQALVPERDAIRGRLTHHGAVGPEARVDQLLGAEALHLLVDHGGERHPTRRQMARERDDRGRHRGDGALHVHRTAAEEPAVADRARQPESRVAGVERHRVGVPAQQQMGPRSFALHADHQVRAAGQDLLELHAEVALAEESPQRQHHLLLLALDSGVARDADELGRELGRSKALDLGIDLLQQVGVGHGFAKCNASRK